MLFTLNNVNDFLANVKTLPETPVIKIVGVHSDHVVIGQQLSLICSLSTKVVNFTLKWKVPHNHRHEVCRYFIDIQLLLLILVYTFVLTFYQSGRVQAGKFEFLNSKHGVSERNVGKLALNIYNVKFEDEGEYICEANTTSKSKNYATYTLKAHCKYIRVVLSPDNKKII